MMFLPRRAHEKQTTSLALCLFTHISAYDENRYRSRFIDVLQLLKRKSI